jgi:hypothetical protein
LIAKSFICSFCIAHFIFTLTLCFHLGLIQPLTFNLLMCECKHRLDTSSMHLTMHDIIRNVTYVLAWGNGHIVWREWWYTLMSRVSLQVDLYMT